MTRLVVSLAVEQLRRRVPGGIGTYTRALLKGMGELPADERPSLTIVASRPPRGPDPLAGLGYPVASSRLPGPLMTRAWDVARARVGKGSDVVHSVSLAAPVPFAGVPLVTTVHDVAWRTMPEAYPPRGRRWHEAALRRAAARAALIVVPSEATAEAVLHADVGIGRDRLVVVSEGADHLEVPDAPAAAALLGRLGVTGPYIVSVSTLEPRKNLARLVEAYGLARPRLPEHWPLVVVGPSGWGPLEAGVTDKASAGVVFTGAVGGGTLAAIYRGARCSAYVPMVEGFGLPVLEAMSQGTPVVASPVPSSGGASLEVDPNDVVSIADGLVAAAFDEETRARLVSAGLKRAAELRWVDTARAHLAVWERAASESESRR
ncbi:MAG: glycosyltransferase family 1 protein [Acidimicrobiales bacterium]|jgi:alpha-1,3-rhamnosyl/mannosyltransferase